jgi:hypothetical protein
VIALQRTAGNAAVARAIAARRRPAGRVLARLRLTPDRVMSAVQSIPFMKTKLEGQLRGETMKDQVERAVAAYSEMFGSQHRGRTNNAVMLAMALEGVARMIAEELYDPSIQAELADKLFDLYEPEIRAATGLAADNGPDLEARRLTQVLISDDPLAMYMHNELRIEVAAERIRDMADMASNLTQDDSRTPEAMFDLLRQKWEAQMAAQSATTLEAAHPGGKAYSVREAPGELSAQYLRKLFGPDVDEPERKASGHGLKLTADTAKRLDDLRAEVLLPRGPAAALPPRFPGMTGKQERHLTEIEAGEQPAVIGDARDRLAAAVSEALGVPRSRAAGIVGEVEAWLQTVPLTITVWGKDWFEAAAPTGAAREFTPATRNLKTSPVADVFEKPGAVGSIDYAGKYTHAKYGAERGDKYLRFRRWKDDLMTGLLDFSPAELPTFGAANVNWDRNRGTAEGAYKDGGEIPVGTNYYGDTHFKLKDALRNRLVYTATDHGPPRRAPLLALADFVTGTQITGLLNARNASILLEVIDAAKTHAHNLRAELPFEIQIFGGVDIGRDVDEIHYAPGVSDAVKRHIGEFCTAVPSVAAVEIASAGKASLIDAKLKRREIVTGIRAALLGSEAPGPGLQPSLRESTVQALTVMRFQVQSDEDLALLKRQIQEVGGFLAYTEPKVAAAFLKFKEYVEAYDPGT